jgi:Zn-dependent protease
VPTGGGKYTRSVRWALRFRIGGIPVRVEPAFVIVLLLLGWAPGTTPALMALWVAVAFVSVLVHELGHAVAGRLFGDAPRIVLHGMLGYTVGSGASLSRGKSILVSLAGSLAGIIVLGLPALLLSGAVFPAGALNVVLAYPSFFPTVWVLLAYLAWANLWWSILNLLPILPFDGGRVATSLLEVALGERARQLGHVVSAVVVGTIAVWALTRGSTYGLVFGAIVVGWNINELQALREKPLHEDLREVYRFLQEGDHDSAATRAEYVLARSRSHATRRLAVEALMWARIDQGRLAEARSLVDHLAPGSAPPPMPRAYLAVADEPREVAIDATVRSLLEEPRRAPRPKLVDALVARGVVPEVVDRLFADGREEALTGANTLALALHIGGRFQEAARIGERVFHDGRVLPALVAYNVACSLARAGSSDKALTWLEKAVDMGFQDVETIDGDTDVDGLRDSDRFRALRARIPEKEA